eukprot:CAMPEP_0113549640 /NCGR_PEP_ID=MMETSP0015_2-20120614/13546_1 /TAXON_ID=2838 /ORGANISM="Odontella" /LENGTH=582 /DNA_ID=CAMNT_0000450373 /DNA_START=494 /DNA_END=2242 /DNA_ORIENTATION=- /assembly_acc=CAM_ASM_000160
MVALCHSPNYNFKGEAYYDSTDHPEEFSPEDSHVEMETNAEKAALDEMMCLFPSQQVAERHSRLAVEKVEELRSRIKTDKGKPHLGVEGKSDPPNTTRSYAVKPLLVPSMISDMEYRILLAIRTFTCNPGVEPSIAEELVGRPYADALRNIYYMYPGDAEVAYFLAESLMVLNAWSLYEYPSGKALSQDVGEIESILEVALQQHPQHAGLCHLYAHLSEMSAHPSKALRACGPLRINFPDAGHLVHMATHIDVLVGDYDSCVRWNYEAIEADQRVMRSSPDTAGTVSFYFGYIVHNYHMLVYGCILGGMEEKAMDVATNLNGYLFEDVFVEHPELTAYLESYAALDIHVMVRFGRWQKILGVALPRNPQVMLYRSAILRYARALAYANLGDCQSANREADIFDEIRSDSNTENRILHNNTVSDLLAVDAPMIRGEIAYHEGRYDLAFSLLRNAVALQDGLNYDEPWGKMQPIRHALGGLLLEKCHIEEAEQVFREDLKFHPRNPWGLVGLIHCLEYRDRMKSCGGCCGPTPAKSSCDAQNLTEDLESEIQKLKADLTAQRKSEWADFKIIAPCACCRQAPEI